MEAVPESYLQIAESCGAAEAFREMGAAPGGVLFHCSAGKDRTGTLSAIMLTLAEVPEETIVQDYLLTGVCIRGRQELLFQRFPELDRNIVITQPRHIRGFLKLWREKYGTAENYLQAIGLTNDQIEKLRRKLC